MNHSSVLTKHDGEVFHIILNRPQVRNAVNKPTAKLLADAFREYEASSAKCAIFYGTGGNFCAGADLTAVGTENGNNIDNDISHDAPMGPSRFQLKKPLIVAVAGYAVAGGLELSLLGDIRIAEQSAIFGVFCRRVGVPLIDGGTVRLPRIIGMGNAMYMITTGLPVNADEALRMGLVNKVVKDGTLLEESLKLAQLICSHPQTCLLQDRLSAYEQFDLPFLDAMKNEFDHGEISLKQGDWLVNARKFAGGQGRHGSKL